MTADSQKDFIMVENALILACVMVLFWILSIISAKVSFVDGVWGAGFVILAWSSLVPVSQDPALALGSREKILIALITLWGIRLSVYLFRRFFHHGEDARYQDLLQERKGFNKHFFTLWAVFGVQGLLIYGLSLPVMIEVLNGANGLNWHGWLGIIVWTIGIFFEWVADWQLARFKKRSDTEKDVMDEGLWAFTRHPNYFGEAVLWWGIWLITLDIYTVFAPVLLTILLLKVSGVPMLEKSIRKRRQGYEDYAQRTSAFFPLPPKKQVAKK